jgi:serine/threonine-protein kinase
MMAHQFKEPTPITELSPEVPVDLIAVVQRLMKKAPDQRFSSTGELVEALKPQAAAAAGKEAARPRPAPVSSGSHPDKAPLGIPPLPRNNAAPVAPSTPTPKPAALGILPTRSSLRGTPTPPPAAPAPASTPPQTAEPSAQEEAEEHVVPGAMSDVDDTTWEERLGPLGITISAIAACGLIFSLARLLNLI